MIGKQLGHYRIDVRLGEDGLGILYLAHHLATGIPATMRHFNAELADVGAVARYLEIARAASALGHPGILAIHASVWGGRNAAVVGDPLPVGGETLAGSLAREQRFAPEIAAKLGWQIAAAVGTAHTQNLYHLLLRPDGIWVHPDADMIGGYRTRILDFGAAAFLGSGVPNFRSPRIEALGLPLYLSPEQCQSGMADWRSDVYALGCILFHMTAGRPPFPGTSALQIADAHKTQTLQGPGVFFADVPVELHTLIERMLSKAPASRPTMPAVAYELERIFRHYWPPTTHERTVQVDLRIGEPPPPASDPPLPRPRRWPIVAAASCLGLAAAGLALAITQPWNTPSAPSSVSAPDAVHPAHTPDGGR